MEQNIGILFVAIGLLSASIGILIGGKSNVKNRKITH